jgi:tetratricopeptide (TPR) repeat protein
MRLLALTLVLAAARAEAQAPDPAALEASGSKHFELAEYAAAITDFKEAFRLSDRPELLFNIAQAYRLSGDCVQARTFYRTFLRRVPDAPNAIQVKGRIDELEACANAAPPPPVVTNAPPTTTTPPPPPPAGRTWKTSAGLASLGVGVLGVGFGTVFAVRGNSKQSELADACAVECTGDVARELDEAGKAANRNAAIGLIAGGAFLVTGAVLVILDRPRSHESGPAVSVGASGASASWRWRF